MRPFELSPVANCFTAMNEASGALMLVWLISVFFCLLGRYSGQSWGLQLLSERILLVTSSFERRRECAFSAPLPARSPNNRLQRLQPARGGVIEIRLHISHDTALLRGHYPREWPRSMSANTGLVAQCKPTLKSPLRQPRRASSAG